MISTETLTEVMVLRLYSLGHISATRRDHAQKYIKARAAANPARTRPATWDAAAIRCVELLRELKLPGINVETPAPAVTIPTQAEAAIIRAKAALEHIAAVQEDLQAEPVPEEPPEHRIRMVKRNTRRPWKDAPDYVITGCSCGWLVPDGVDADDAIAVHVAAARQLTALVTGMTDGSLLRAAGRDAAMMLEAFAEGGPLQHNTVVAVAARLRAALETKP